MLVLTRKPDQEIIIGDSIHIRVGEVRGNRVRLLIEAPAAVKICRKEVRHDLVEVQEDCNHAELCAAEV